MNTVVASRRDGVVVGMGHVGGGAAYDFLRREVVTFEVSALIEDRGGARWKLSKVRRTGLTAQGFCRSVDVRMVGVGGRHQPYVKVKAARLLLAGY